jgi:hypothetical protein
VTLNEAVQQGISRVRSPEWNPKAYMVLGRRGPWLKIFNPSKNESILRSQVDWDEQGWEPYTGSPSEDE